MNIRGGNLSRPIAAGAEIILTVHIDESRRITVDAELPNGNEPLSEEIYVPDREERTPTEEVARLADSIGPLLEQARCRGGCRGRARRSRRSPGNNPAQERP